jgi:hypothetical protein
MRARILMDEPLYGSPTGAQLMKKVIVELWSEPDGWSKTMSLIVPADLETQSEIDKAVRKTLRDNGKDEAFDWA